MHSLARVVVIALTIVTLTLVAAVGVSAGSGTFGSSHASASLASLLNGHVDLGFLHPFNGASSNGKDKEKGLCHEPKKHHKHGTPGHKNHPCSGDQDDDTD